MSTKVTRRKSTHTEKIQTSEIKFYTPALERMVEYLGTVNYATSERVLSQIKDLLLLSREEITLLVTSTGGPSGTAMSFYDTIRHVLQADITTVGSGDVDSSGILIFLAGTTRYVTPNTTLLLHLAGRVFDGGTRFSAPEMEAMLREDKLKDFHYASIVASNSRGLLTTEAVLSLMERTTILTPPELVALGLADSILENTINTA
jgi:ATP-dependent protease ClpP protease subunit